jgi:heme exporter protein A
LSAAAPPPVLLEGRDLAVVRGVAKLFQGVSFRVSAGEWIAVRGPNGSGKTTLLRCVAGLTHAEAGSVTRAGDFIYAGHLPGINDSFSADENLRGALALRGVAVDAAAATDALERVGLARRRQLPARRLSAGQRRRIGLARLMLDPAPIWILDEPLTALDDAGQALFEDLLARHLARGGLGLVATHHPLAPAPVRELRIGA